ncbi:MULTISPECIES: hypothetical protein [Streptosporangium]|uniref:Prenyltransferase n=1 Tax=Streptosporangium brasiliense TaxID=47480 RepID=A0ABT9R2F5_9ACTN|nr:hypothetical protein [Streptosporangium brasiliense]MDP9862640.1 hypothetical protein [Streptosporangium brasiliense]
MASMDLTATARLAAAFGDLAVRLGVRDDAGATAAELLRITGEPRRHSILTGSAVPVEVSLKLGEQGAPTLRCVIDMVEHRADDWEHSLAHARSVTGCSTEEQSACLLELFRTHLTGAPADLPAPLMLGLGYGTGGRRRGTVYFRTGWLGPDELAARFPLRMKTLRQAEHLHGCRLPGAVEVMGYDLAGGELTAWKTYKWLPTDPDRAFGDRAGTHPDLLPARRLHDLFVTASRPRPADRSLFLQLSHDGTGTRQKVFFFCAAWGWDGPEGVAELLGSLQRAFGHDLGPLLRLREAMAARGVRVRLGLIAVGGDPRRPSLTFYFWPTGEE